LGADTSDNVGYFYGLDGGNLGNKVRLRFFGCCQISFSYFFFFDFPAACIAAATACFCGWPALTISLMLAEIVFCEDPFLSGMAV
jgi:hypothetical protein